MKSKILFIYLCGFLALVEPLQAEDSPNPTPTESATAAVIEDEEVPLDAWIIRKKEVEVEVDEPAVDPTASSSVNITDIGGEAEEKRIYKALLENFQKDTEAKSLEKQVVKETKNPQTVFKKTALSKRDMLRIDKLKKVQRRLIYRQKKEFAHLLTSKKEIVPTLRYCILNYPIIGLPSEVRQLDSKVQSADLSSDWKNGIALIVQSSCNVVLYTGLYGRTLTKRKAFIDKTLDFIELGTGISWKYLLNSNDTNSAFMMLYDPNVIDLFKYESLSGLTLRRGGVFKESEFSMVPLEISFEIKNQAKTQKYTFISFDLRDSTSPIKKLDIHYQMQMAATLLEAAVNRTNKRIDETVVLAGRLGENQAHPVYQIVQGILAPVDFLKDKACVLTDSSGEDVKAELFICDQSKLKKEPRTLLGLFSDLTVFMPKPQKIAISREIKNIDSEFFIAEASIRSLKNVENNRLYGASYDVIKGKQFNYSFLYVDLSGAKKE